MAKAAAMTGPVLTPRPPVFPWFAPRHKTRLCGTTSPPIPAVLTLQCGTRPSGSTFCNRLAFGLLPRSESGLRAVPSCDLRISVICSAAYGSTNGNGRPGSAFQKSGVGYNHEFLTDDPKFAKGRGDRFGPGDLQIDNISESPSRRRGRKIGSRSGEAHKNSTGAEKQGEDPYRIVENGQKVYLDELDVITLLEPPPFLRPLKSVYYNHAAFLWKKIGDIPEERRHRLLDLLLPRNSIRIFAKLTGLDEARHVTKMWELAKLRYEDPHLFVEHAADMLPTPAVPDLGKPMVWDGRVIQVPWYLTLFSRFQKVFFVGSDKQLYGRVITGGKYLRGLTDRLAPLYFQVMHADSVMATEEPCDIVLEYGNGQLHLRDSIPPGFANPAKHLPPFNDKACDYLRAVGPGVIVGQAWVEGKKLEQYPRQLFGEFIMVRRFL